jgi:3-hydroxyacyl-CoA dehydrogenase
MNELLTAAATSGAGTVGVEHVGAILILTIDHAPINALNLAVRSCLLASIRDAEDVKVRAVVIRSKGRHFVAGADIREFDHEPQSPLLNDVLNAIEKCSKPVIAGMQGSVLGGGLELALACHYRLAASSAVFGMPEIRLGLLPGSGGTQRLPRLIGMAKSLEFILSGDPINCQTAQVLGIVDRVSDSADLTSDALAWANELLSPGRPLPSLRDRAVPGPALSPTFVAEQRTVASRKSPGVDAVEFIIECVGAAATLPFDEGLALGRRRFEECRRSNASKALRYRFFAERRTEVKDNTRSVGSVGVLGAGTMGSGIAISLAMAGLQVTLADTNAQALAAGMQRLRLTIEASVSKGRIDQASAEAAIARVASGARIDDLAGADFVIEAVFENLSVKENVFRSLGMSCKPGAILASNTSTLDIDAIALASGRAHDVVGMHFFSPANIMRLVEVVRGNATSPEVIATVLALTKRIGKLGVVVGNCFGFVGNRMLYAYGRENQLLMLEGATPTQIDSVMERFGMAMGPNAVGDLAGLDVGYRARRELKNLPDDPRYYRVANLLVEKGRLGQKAKAGAFDYVEGSRRPVRSIEVEAMIEAEAARLGVARRVVSDDEIRDRCLFALINEGAELLAEGIAESSTDVDTIWCNGYGFPRYRGGPLWYADEVGLPEVLSGIQGLADQLGERYWKASPLLVDLARRRANFATWKPV